MTDKPQTFAERIAEVRERLFEGVPGPHANARIVGFDAAVAVYEAEIAEKDAEIARLERERDSWYRNYTDLAESRTVTDAQRERVEFLLAAGFMQRRSFDEMASLICDVFKQPAAEGAPS